MFLKKLEDTHGSSKIFFFHKLKADTIQKMQVDKVLPVWCISELFSFQIK